MDDVVEEGSSTGDSVMTALLIVAFGFIFLGIILASYTLHKNFDSPFLGVMQKNADATVEAQAERDFAEKYGEAAPVVDEGDGEDVADDETGE